MDFLESKGVFAENVHHVVKTLACFLQDRKSVAPASDGGHQPFCAAKRRSTVRDWGQGKSRTEVRLTLTPQCTAVLAELYLLL